MKLQQLLILSPGFPANEQDTTCLPPIQQFVLCVRRLYPEMKMRVVAFQYPFSNSEYKWNGIDVISIGGCNRPGVRRVWTWYKAWKILKQYSRNPSNTGLLSLWLTECALIGKWFSRLNKIKHFMWIQGQDVKKENQYINRIRPKAQEVIAISEFTRNELQKNFGIQPFLIANNGINTAIFPELNEDERPLDILGAGSLIHLKRYDLFLSIISRLKKNFPQIKVGIAGTGVNEQEIKQQAATLDLLNNVRFYGSIPHQEVLVLMSRSKIFLHTSDYEGNSTVLIEALYSGCKVFSTRELSEKGITDFHIINDPEICVNELSHLLKEKLKPQRVLFNDMESTARLILSQYQDAHSLK